MKKLFLFFGIIWSSIAFAARVDTIALRSAIMQKNISCVAIIPDSYHNSDKRFPVVYLLHGYSGSYSNWIIRVPDLKKYADEFQLIVVCPDGNYNSWYFDSPIDKNSKYETYISKEVPHGIDSIYRTLADRNHRAITGLSMGGHGALFLSQKYPEIFGAAGSMSGAVDLVPFKSKFDLTKVLGDTLNGPIFFENSVVNNCNKWLNKKVSLIIDCGISDPFITANRNLHQQLLWLKIPHDYIERDGGHNWNYWSNSIAYQLLFFHRYFKGN